MIHHPPGSGDPLNIAPMARNPLERTRAVAGTMPATLDIMQTPTKFVRVLAGSRVMFARTYTGHFDIIVNAAERAAYVAAAREIVGVCK